MSWPRQAFRLSKEIVESTSKEEIQATIAGMKEMGICKAPFDQMDILVQERELFVLYANDPRNPERLEEAKKELAESAREVIFRFDNTRPHPKVVTCWMAGRPGHWIDMVDFLQQEERSDIDFSRTVYEIGLELLDILIVLLATKNVEKEVKECKTLRLGIGKKERHQYTTTLKIGKVTERAGESIGSGVTRRPHLRRGHIRRQHHGPNNELTKSIWIEPVFVNADPNWIAERTAYNVSLAAPAKSKELV